MNGIFLSNYDLGLTWHHGKVEFFFILRGVFIKLFVAKGG